MRAVATLTVVALLSTTSTSAAPSILACPVGHEHDEIGEEHTLNKTRTRRANDDIIWILAAEQQSCTNACSQTTLDGSGLVCSNAALNTLQKSSQTTKDAFASAGRSL